MRFLKGNFDAYEVFYSVAMCGSVSASRGLLNMSVPTILRAINKLETNIGFEVFVRTNEGVALTPAGEKMFEVVHHARRALNIAEHTIKDNFTGNNSVYSVSPTTPRFSIAISNAIPFDDIMTIIRKALPTDIQFTITTTENALESLCMGIYELALVEITDQVDISRDYAEILRISGVTTSDKRQISIYRNAKLPVPIGANFFTSTLRQLN